LFVTNRCDLRCQHCIQGYPDKSSDFPIDLLEKLLLEALPFGVKHVGLTGGEPCMHPLFQKIVDTIVLYGYTWGFVTNGQRTEPYLTIMKLHRNEFKSVHLSIDSAKAKLHDEIRSKNGVYKKAIDSAKKYIDNGFSVWINSSLNRKNKTEIKELIKLTEELGAIGIQFAGTIPNEQNQDLVLRDEEALSLYQEIISFSNDVRIRIKTTSALYTHGGVHFCNSLDLNNISINSNGEMIFCCDTRQDKAIIGSLWQKSLSSLIQDRLEISAYLQKLRVGYIVDGRMEEGFDSCAFCNSHFPSP